MKKLVVLFVLVSAFMLMVSTVGAAPATYDSGFQVQNLSGSEATIVIDFYAQDGSVAYNMSDTIAANDSNTYYPLPDGVAPGFDGSVVISSNQPVVAITNVLGDNFDFGASYGSFDSGTDTVNLPLIMKGNAGQYDTWFNVQNAGTAATEVTVSYADTACTEGPFTIQPGAARTFDQASNACLPNSYVGAATVSAPGGEIVATVMETGDETLYAYNGFTGGATNPVMPLVQFNNVGYHSGIQIQNTGGSSTDVTVSYTPASGQPGTACTETLSVGAGDSATFGLFAFSLSGSTSSNCTFGQRFIGSAQVTGNTGGHELVGIVNQTNFANYGSSYNAFDPSTASETVTMPLIMDRNAGFYTGFNLMNVGGGSVSVNCTFTGTSYTVGGTLAAGGALNALQINEIASSYVGSATCSAPGGSIIAVVNELGDSTTSDLLFTYEAFNQ